MYSYHGSVAVSSLSTQIKLHRALLVQKEHMRKSIFAASGKPHEKGEETTRKIYRENVSLPVT